MINVASPSMTGDDDLRGKLYRNRREYFRSLWWRSAGHDFLVQKHVPMHEVRASGEPPSIGADALRGISEPDDEDGHVVCRVVLVGMLEQLLCGFPRIRQSANEVAGALIVHDVPKLQRRSISESLMTE